MASEVRTETIAATGKATERYAWQRFWARRTGHLDLSDGGFLIDPTDGRLWPSQEMPLSLPDLADRPVLVLLGEPGMGKSAALADESDRIAKASKGHDAISIHIDLRAFSTEILLYRRVFESPEFLSWKQGKSRLHLHLDSLDEALLRIDSIANLLADELPRFPTERMSLRIACRTAVWPGSILEPAFQGIWGERNVEVLELAPLRRRDAVAAAQANGIDADSFVKELYAVDAVPFAIKPLTLNLLLAQFRRLGRLPHSAAELYASGCLILCEEQSPSRRGAQQFGNLNAKQRLRLVSRLAAVTMLANRYAIWTGPNNGTIPDEDVPISELCVGREEGDFQAFDVTDAHVREVLDTGLFSARGANRMGWAHQSYAEFLAAYYLNALGVPQENIIKVLAHPAGGVVPQLSVVTAWAASLNKEVRNQFISHEPLILLRGDLVNWSAEDLASLTASLLAAYDKKNVSDFVFGISAHYKKLAYPGLAAQLRPYVVDKAGNVVARRAALMIADACALKELQPELLQVALDVSDEPTLRARAVSALATCGDAAVPAQLMALARGESGPDPFDDIKGQALEILWPAHISSTELFSILSQPNEGYVGSYVMFLTKQLPEMLKVGDLKPALEWATNFIKSVDHSGDYQRKSLADSILMLGWKHFKEPELTELFIDHVFALLHQFGELLRGTDHTAQQAFQKELKADVARRRAFMTEVCKRPLSQIEGFQFVRASFVERADFEWLVSISPGGASPISGLDAQSISELIQATFDHNSAAHFEALYDAAMRWELLRRAYWALFDGIEIHSRAAEDAREHLRMMRELERDRPPPVSPPPPERVQARLAEFERGELQAWWMLNCELTLTPTSTHYGSDVEYSIMDMPGWASADAATRQRILDAAETYLANATPQTDKWLGTSTFQRPDIAAYRALRLLKELRPPAYEKLGPAIWKKWAPVAVALPWETSAKEAEIHLEITHRASRNAPQEVAATVSKVIASERAKTKAVIAQGGKPQPISFFVLRSVEHCWGNADLRSVGLAELKSTENSPEQFTELLEPLLKASVDEARAYALAVLEETSDGRRPFALAAAEELVTHTAAQSWDTVWGRIAGDELFGMDLFPQLAHHRAFRSTFHAALTEKQLGNLYVWIEQKFPRSSESEATAGQAHWVGPRESLAHLRDDVLRHLVNLGTPAAVEELRSIVGLLPGLIWLPYQLTAAEQIMRMKTWVPLIPREILRVTQSRDGKLIATSEDLCEVLIGALRKYESDLHGELTPVRQIWDRQGDGSFRPVDENAFSDHVVGHLRRSLIDSGIILNREVEIGRVPGAPVGDRTDIKIDALRRLKGGSGFDSITAIVEVKGCWNPQLLSALKDQLYEKYVAPLGAPVGIYLVGWFPKSQWDANDSRRRETRDLAISEIQSQLDAQAAGLPQGFAVRAVVIDCRLPSARGRRSRRRGHGRRVGR